MILRRICLCIMCLAISAMAESRPMAAIAVLPFNARSLDTDAVDGIVSAMGSELINTGKFRVMERSQMQEILKEQGFQQSGACDGSECAVQMGKLLAVSHIVVGTIAKVGSTYTLTAKLVSVETGEVIRSTTRNSRASVDAVLTDILPLVAKDLAQADLASSSAVTPATAEASSESHWGWWVAGGAVLLAGGAAAAVLLTSGGSSSSNTNAPGTSNTDANNASLHASW